MYKERWEMVEKIRQQMFSSEHFRYGQSVFNALKTFDPDSANKLTTTEVDCYYDDSKVEDFKNTVNTIWHQEEIELYKERVNKLISQLSQQRTFTEDLLIAEQTERYDRKLHQIALNNVLKVLAENNVEREKMLVYYLTEAEEELNGKTG